MIILKKRNPALICLSVLLILSCFSSVAQDRSNYNLLWRIEHDDLKHSSYLFGTMHVKDERVFDFSDSVLFALDKCNVLALEIDPDDYFRALSKEDGDDKTDDDFKNQLSEKEYRLLAEKLKKELDIEMEDVRVKSPLIFRSLLYEKKLKSTSERDLTLDSYLHRVAKQQGKKVLGLEDINKGIRAASGFDSQFEKEVFVRNFIYDSLSTPKSSDVKDYVLDVQKGREDLIALYHKGDLDLINSRFQISTAFARDPFRMVERNISMSGRIDTAVQKNSTFIAVGAAHLLGEKGLIDLLMAKGYKLTPVEATFTGVAADLEKKFKETSGYRFEKLSQGFIVDLPGRPIETPLPNSNVPAYIYQDIKERAAVMVIVVDAPDIFTDARQKLDDMIGRMKDRGMELVDRSDMEYQGLPAMEAEFNHPVNGSGAVLRAFVRGNKVYAFMVFTNGEKWSRSRLKDFFEGIQFIQITKNKEGWKRLEDEKGGFETWFPGEYNRLRDATPMEDEDNTVLYIHSFTAVDPEKESSYILYHYDYPLNYYVDSLSFVVRATREVVQEEYNATQDSIRDFTLGPYPGKEMFFTTSGATSIVVRVLIRGNRVFLQMIQNREFEESVRKKFFEEFDFLPLAEMKLETYQSKSGNYSIDLPTEVEDDQSTEQSVILADTVIVTGAADRGSQNLVMLWEYEYNPYVYFENSDSLFTYFYPELKDENLEILGVDTVLDGAQPYYEFISRKKESSYTIRERLYWKGSKVYIIQVLIALENDLSVADPIFNSFQILDTGSFDLFASKSQLIFENLQSDDPAKFNEARSAVGQYNFKSSDLDGIYRTLRSEMPMDTGIFISVKESFLDILATVNDDRTVGFIDSMFHNSEDSQFRSTVLASLQYIDSEEALNSFKEKLMLLDDETARPFWDMGYFYDTVSNVLDNLDFLVKLSETRPALADLSIGVISSYAVSDSTFKEALKPYSERFKELFRIWTDSLDGDNTGFYAESVLNDLFYISLEISNPSDFVSFYQTLIDKGSYDDLILGVLGLVAADVQVPKKYIKNILKDEFKCYNFFYRLARMDRPDVFQPYLKQKDLARIFVKTEFHYQDYTESEVKKLKQKDVLEIEWQGKKWRIYVFVYKTTYDDEEAFALTGLQPVDGSLRLTEDHTTLWFGNYVKGEYDSSVDGIKEYYKSLDLDVE